MQSLHFVNFLLFFLFYVLRKILEEGNKIFLPSSFRNSFRLLFYQNRCILSIACWWWLWNASPFIAGWPLLMLNAIQIATDCLFLYGIITWETLIYLSKEISIFGIITSGIVMVNTIDITSLEIFEFHFTHFCTFHCPLQLQLFTTLFPLSFFLVLMSLKMFLTFTVAGNQWEGVGS